MRGETLIDSDEDSVPVAEETARTGKVRADLDDLQNERAGRISRFANEGNSDEHTEPQGQMRMAR